MYVNNSVSLGSSSQNVKAIIHKAIELFKKGAFNAEFSEKLFLYATLFLNSASMLLNFLMNSPSDVA